MARYNYTIQNFDPKNMIRVVGRDLSISRKSLYVDTTYSYYFSQDIAAIPDSVEYITYYWRIVASDGEGGVTSSSGWQFIRLTNTQPVE